ncbi:MAG TPA: N-acetylneuraminate lyase [bacterium]|nr:N-acetylneuraminate lyase [bacterium]
MKKLEGVVSALVTPFDDGDNIREDSIRRIINYNLKNGVSGFYVCGSTGESLLLTLDERKRILEIVKDEVKDRAFIIANIGCMGTKFSIELAKHAEETGVDAISSFPPIYYKFSFDEIKEYYFDIADSVNVPLIIYYIPSFTNVEMSLENFSELLEHKNIMGVKFTSMNLFMLERIKALSNKTIFNGFDEVFLGGLSLGADGMIGSTCNIVPAIIRGIYDSFRSKEMEKAYIYQQKLNEIINDIKDFGIIPATKAILSLIGIECGKPRKPFKALGKEEIARLSSLMKSWDIDFRL